MEGHYHNERNQTLWTIHETTPTGDLTLNGDLTIIGDTNLQKTEIIHTATENNDYAFKIKTDSGTYSSNNAVQINYKIDSPSNSTSVVQDVVIDCMDSNPTSTVFGHSISMSGGAISGYGMKTGVDVGPIYSISGSFINATLITLNGSIDVTAALSSGIDPATACFSLDNDTMEIWGVTDKTFIQIGFDIETPAHSSIQPEFEYSTGVGTWSVFSPNDGTVGFKYTGNIIWRLQDIPGWTAVGGKFGIRIRRTRNTLSQIPLINSLAIDSSVIYQWDKFGFLDIHDIRLNQRLDMEVNDNQNFNNTLVVSNPANPSSMRFNANSSRTSFEVGNTNNLDVPANIDIIGGKGTVNQGGNQCITLKSNSGNNYTIGRKKTDNTFRINYDGVSPDYLTTDANTALTVNSDKSTEILNLKLSNVVNDNVETKLLVWDNVSKGVLYRDVSSLPGGGGGPVNPFDQDLNTTNNVEFLSVNINGNTVLTAPNDSYILINQSPAITTGIKEYRFSSNTTDACSQLSVVNNANSVTGHSSVYILTDALCGGNSGNQTAIFEKGCVNKWEIGHQSNTNTFRFNFGVGYTYLTDDSETKLFLDTGGNLTAIGNVTCSAINTGIGLTEVHLMNQNVRTLDNVEFISLNLNNGNTVLSSATDSLTLIDQTPAITTGIKNLLYSSATTNDTVELEVRNSSNTGTGHSSINLRSQLNTGNMFTRYTNNAFAIWISGYQWNTGTFRWNYDGTGSDYLTNDANTKMFLDTTGKLNVKRLEIDTISLDNTKDKIMVWDSTAKSVLYRELNTISAGVLRQAGITLSSASAVVTISGAGLDTLISNTGVTNLLAYNDTGLTVNLVDGTIRNTSGVTRVFELSICTNVNHAGSISYGLRSYVSIDGVVGATVTEIIRSDIASSNDNCSATQRVELQNNGYTYIGIRNITNGNNLALFYLDIKLKAVY